MALCGCSELTVQPNGRAAVPVDETAVSRIFREEYGRSVASLIRAFGDIDAAEDAVQEAFAVALRKWPVTAYRLTRAAGSRRPPATWPSIVSAVMRGDASSSGTSRCSCRRATIPMRAGRWGPWRTTGFG